MNVQLLTQFILEVCHALYGQTCPINDSLTQPTRNVFTTLPESFAELIWDKRFFFPTKYFFYKCSWGSETHTICFLEGDFGVFGAPHARTRGSCGVGKRYTSSNDHDHDLWPVNILERSGLAVKNYHPETLARKNKKI